MKKLLYIFLPLFVFFSVFYTVYQYKNKPSKDSLPEISTVFVSEREILPSDKLVKVTEQNFEPNIITIKKGERVAFFNEKTGYSWPASNPHPTHTDYPQFDPLLPMKAGEVWTYIFDKVGEFPYHDHLDPSKRGVINVTM